MTLSHVSFDSNTVLRAINKIFLYRFLYFSYFNVVNDSWDRTTIYDYYSLPHIKCYNFRKAVA